MKIAPVTVKATEMLLVEEVSGEQWIANANWQHVVDAGDDRLSYLQSVARHRLHSDMEMTHKPPLMRDSRIFCVGKNYSDHASEMGGAPPAFPDIFMRVPTSFVGHQQAIICPDGVTSLDYEGELAAIIGREAKNVSAEHALQYVMGYTIGNDGTVREWQKRTSQYTLGKNVDKSGALGPWILLAGDGFDPQAQQIQTCVDTVIKQKGRTSSMIFSLATVIAFISRSMTLKPGDIIMTGTPSGVGAGQTPPAFLKSGNLVRIRVPSIGTLENTIA